MCVTPPRHTGPMMLQTRCAGCDAPGVAVCTTCRFALLGRRPPESADGIRAAVPFVGRARDVVLGLKYRNRRQVARHLAGLVVNAVVADLDGQIDRRIDLVTWAPTSRVRRRSRGFDQGELVARYVARQLRVPARRLLERSGDQPSQTGRSRRERLAGVSFRARPGLHGARVLVVDDVVTTGATLRSARRALTDAGASAVWLYAVAATPSGVSSARRPNERHPTLVDVAA
jgi:predicted amidophosphoribosyltransferase